MKTPDYTKGWRRLALGWLNRVVRPFSAIKVSGILGATSGWMLYTKPDGDEGIIVSHYQGSLCGLLVHRVFRSNDKLRHSPSERKP